MANSLEPTLFRGALVVVPNAVAPPLIFSDHGVLQEGTVVPVWGWRNPGETIIVTSNGKEPAFESSKDGVPVFKTGAGASQAVFH